MLLRLSGVVTFLFFRVIINLIVLRGRYGLDDMVSFRNGFVVVYFRTWRKPVGFLTRG